MTENYLIQKTIHARIRYAKGFVNSQETRNLDRPVRLK